MIEKIKIITFLAIAVLFASCMALRAEPCVKAYPLHMRIAQKLDDHTYEVVWRRNITAPVVHAIFKSQEIFNRAASLGGHMVRFTGYQDVSLNNGFTDKVPVYEDCPLSKEKKEALNKEWMFSVE